MWEDLSFKDRSKLIELGASQGILDLSTIKHLYNINADGGYLKWKKEIAKHKGIDIDNDNTYNYQAFFEEDPQRAWDMLKKDSKAHFTDKYKTVWHPTFSDESVYSGHKSKYNPQGLVGGHWEGNTFKMSDSLYGSPVSMDERQQYLIDNEPNGASLLESNGTLPVYDDIPWGGVLPEVEITPQYSDGGSIHIAKNKRGTFKAQASRMGMSTQQAASHILANKDDYSPAMVKKAVFAHNFAHAYGGPLDNTFPEAIDNQHIFEDGGKVHNKRGKGMTHPTRAHLVKRFWETDEEFKERTNGMTQEEIDAYNKEVDKEYADMSKHTAEERAQALAEAKKNGTYPKPTIFEELGKASRKMHQSAKNSNSFNRLRRVTTGLENGVKKQVATAKGIAESAQNYANEQAKKKQQQMRDIKKGFDAAATLGEWGAAGYTVGRLTVPRLLSNNTGVMGRVADFFTNNNAQLGANAIGSLADGYQFLTADNKFDKYENEIELGGDTAGVIGGLDIVRNSNIFGRYSKPIDTALDVTGLSAASWDILKNIPPFKYYYGKLKDYVNGTNETEDDNQHASGGSLESDEDSLLAPIIKYYEDTSPSLSIEDQNTFAKGGQMKRARQAVDYFVNKGLTKEQAAGLVGNLMRESGMNIGATNPNSGAYGLGQWLGSRKTRLFKRYGYHPTFEQQLDYIWDELNTSHRRGLQMLRASKTVNDAARNAFGYYEFSAGPEAAVRAMNGAGKNTKWKNPNGTYALNSGIKNAQMIFGEVPVTMGNAGDTLVLDTPESTPNIQPIISNDYAPVIAANLKELPTFGQEEDNDSSIPSFGPQYLAQNLDKLGMTNPLNPFEKGYQLQSPKAIYANMQGLI